MEKFNLLWVGESHAVICKRSEVQEFVLKHTAINGVPNIAVHGKCREICWKSLGAGLYKVWTIDPMAKTLPRNLDK
jgi:hypothetical protein